VQAIAGLEKSFATPICPVLVDATPWILPKLGAVTFTMGLLYSRQLKALNASARNRHEGVSLSSSPVYQPSLIPIRTCLSPDEPRTSANPFRSRTVPSGLRRRFDTLPPGLSNHCVSSTLNASSLS